MNKKEVQTDPRLAGLVRRYHTWPSIREQTIGEHSWQILRLYLMIFGVPRVEVMVYAVKHDMGELQTGDPPYPIKAQNPVLKQEMDRLDDVALESMNIQLPALTPEEKILFKFCDLLDCIEHAKNEVLMGNQYFYPVFDQGDALAAMIARMSPSDQKPAAIYLARQGVRLVRSDGTTGRNPPHDSWPVETLAAYDANFRESI